VRFDAVRAALAGQWDARRFVIEQTFYYDWYYGLKRLFREGARPDLVIVMLSSRQWIRTDLRGDYSAHYMMSPADLSAAARDLSLNATQTTNLVFARASKFWGVRAEIRNFLLGRLMPDLGRLMNFSSVADLRPLLADEVERVATGRIARMQALASEYGARLVVLIPVMLDTKDGNGWLGLMNAARGANVSADARGGRVVPALDVPGRRLPPQSGRRRRLHRAADSSASERARRVRQRRVGERVALALQLTDPPHRLRFDKSANCGLTAFVRTLSVAVANGTNSPLLLDVVGGGHVAVITASSRRAVLVGPAGSRVARRRSRLHRRRAACRCSSALRVDRWQCPRLDRRHAARRDGHDSPRRDQAHA
jgi:hypothetical protein